MATKAPTTEPGAAGEARNIKVTVLANRTAICGAIVAAGPCDFPLTQPEADALVKMGKVRIDGIF